MILIFFIAIWNIVVYVASGGEGDSDFSDAGTPAQQNQEKKKVVKLMQKAPERELNPRHNKLSAPRQFRTASHFPT